MQKKGFKKILIIILVILIMVIIYIWYSSRPANIKPQGAVVPVSLPTEMGGEEKTQLPQAREIIRVLSLLNKIKLDTDFFNSKSFKSLDDFSVQLPFLESGRSNPFAPLSNPFVSLEETNSE